MSDWKKIAEAAEAVTSELHKHAFLPMPPDQTGEALPPQQPQQPQPQQGPQAPMQPQPGMPQGQPPAAPADPMMRLQQLEQVVQEQNSALQEMMGALQGEIGPALEQVMQKMTTHDNAILEVSTLASGAANRIDGLTQQLMEAMQAPEQQAQQ